MKTIIYLLLFYSIVCFPQVSYDTSFGVNGVAKNCNNFTISNGSTNHSMGFQSNGKIITMGWNAVGGTTCSATLVRYNADGSIDTSFGINGVIENTMCGTVPPGFYPFQMVIQPDDKLLIMGLQQSDANYYWVMRLSPDGVLDTSFNSIGYKIISLGTMQDRGQCIALQPDGKILLGGTSGSVGQYFTMIRLTTTGAFDTTFGTNGVVQTLFPNSAQSFGTCIAVQPDGKLVMGGYAQTYTDSPFEFAVARYMPNGTLDATFGIGGMITTDIVPNASDQIANITLQPDGKIIAVGLGDIANTNIMKGVRYLPNGSLDTTFADNGIVSFSNSYSYFPSVALQSDGKIIVTGGQDTCLIYRINSNGTLDNTLVTNDFLMPLNSSMNQTARKVLIQSNGKILIGGGYNTSVTPYIICTFVLRLNPGELGIEEFTTNTAVLYPNPTTGLCTLQLQEPVKEAAVEVYDVMGRKVYSNFLGSSQLADGSLSADENAHQLQLDLTQYPSGAYFVTIKTETGTMKQTIIKK